MMTAFPIKQYVRYSGGTVSDFEIRQKDSETLRLAIKQAGTALPIPTDVDALSEKVSFTFQPNNIIPLPKEFFSFAQTTADSQLYAQIVPHKPLTIYDLGWSAEKAAAIRGLWGSFIDDWDDPSMDVYDEF